jgi:two-component system phosphate regulon sensor histidine kinase PhoR
MKKILYSPNLASDQNRGDSLKTTPFLIRVAICLLLSLIPVPELENQIYSARLQFRTHWARPPELIIIGLDSAEYNDPPTLRNIQSKILPHNPKLILMNLTTHWNHLLIDSDGVVRRAFLFPKGQPSLTYSAYNQLHLNLQALHKIKEPHLVNYLGPSGTFPHCSTIELQQGHCSSFEGKIVLLSEENEGYPTFHTPLGEMALAEILANDIQTIINQQPIYQIWLPIRFLISLAMILMAAFAILYYPVMMSSILITGLGSFVILIVFQFVFQIFHLYIPSANMIGSLLITYLVFTGYRLAIQENLQWRSLKQAQHLRELDQMKTNFLSLVSHDLKTPLAKIQAMVERLRRELQLPTADRSDWKDLIDSIENSNNEMKRYISSILNLSKIESQKVILNMKSNDLNLLIKQALRRLAPLAQQKNITFQESLEPLFSIECDEDLMRQVLTNLIDNAIKYSPNGSKIIVRSLEDDSFVRVEVEDFGPGIPKDQLQRPIKEDVKGSGLGLYLSKYFIELHGGTIRLKTTEGKGTTFTFTLPLNGIEGETILG